MQEHYCSTGAINRFAAATENSSKRSPVAGDNSESEHTHTCESHEGHVHTVSIDIPAHSHSITIASGRSGNTGSIGGNAAVDLSKSVKGYAVIFIMKVR